VISSSVWLKSAGRNRRRIERRQDLDVGEVAIGSDLGVEFLLDEARQGVPPVG
jgi:hypothetical protein